MTHINTVLEQLKDRNRSTPYIVILQTQFKIQRVMQLGKPAFYKRIFANFL